MYCPRCGAPNTETTKFCRQCGLALLEVTTYVATGGASSLQSVANTPVVQAGSFTPKQKKILAILASLFVPLASLIFLSETGAPDAIVAPFVFSIPILITLSVMYFNNQAKRLEQAQRSAPSFIHPRWRGHPVARGRPRCRRARCESSGRISCPAGDVLSTSPQPALAGETALSPGKIHSVSLHDQQHIPTA